MGRYFNKTRTPLAASTTKGNVVMFPSRGWAYVPITEESSPSIQTHVRKGLLVRADAPEDVLLMAPPVVASVAKPAAAKVADVPSIPAWHTREAERAVAAAQKDHEKPSANEDPDAPGYTTSDGSAEVSDPDDVVVALDGPSVADSQSRRPRRR